MTRLLLGVIGHVDHGKTELVRALTGQDTDRLAEEKQRGISIALGFAHLTVGAETVIDLIDMPGHERFVRTMISGATGIDAVLLVVAANEGVKPQTVEHVHIATLLGLRRAVIAVSKTDLVSREEAKRIAGNAAQLLKRSGFDPLPPVLTSAVKGEGIEDLRQALAALAANQHPCAADGVAFLPIDRSFAIAGHGPVVTGTLRGAGVSEGDRLDLLPSQRTVRVRTVQVHGARVTTALPGQRVALNLRDVEISCLKRGMALAAPNTLQLSDWLTISVRTVSGVSPLHNGTKLRALLGTDEFDARLRLLDRDVLDVGQDGLAQLHCARPVACPAGEHVILRLASPPRTVGGGKVLEPVTWRRRRHCPGILDHLRQLRDLPPAAVIGAEIERAGPAGTTLQHLSHLSALAKPRIVALLRSLPVASTRSGLVVRKADMDKLLLHIPSLLAPHAEGLAYEKLLSALPGTGIAVLDEALARLVARGAIRKQGGQFLVPRPEEDRIRARNEATLASRISEVLRLGELTPPTPKEIGTDPQTRRAVDRLVRDGVIVRAVDRAKGKEILFHRDAIEQAQRRLAPLLEQEPGLLVTEIGSALGISRKYCMPLLAHLDAIRFTFRIEDRRILYAAASSVK